jgi:hypothetical protein
VSLAAAAAGAFGFFRRFATRSCSTFVRSDGGESRRCAVAAFGQPTAAGWGIPMVSDIAFSPRVLALSRVPDALKIFLVASPSPKTWARTQRPQGSSSRS